MADITTGTAPAAGGEGQNPQQTNQQPDVYKRQVKSLVWEAMAKERPDLYRQVNEFLNSKKQDGLEEMCIRDRLFSRIRMNRYYSTRKVTEQDVAKLFPKLAEEGRKKELNFLHGISQSKWGIRGAVNVYNLSLIHI